MIALIAFTVFAWSVYSKGRYIEGRHEELSSVALNYSLHGAHYAADAIAFANDSCFSDLRSEAGNLFIPTCDVASEIELSDSSSRFCSRVSAEYQKKFLETVTFPGKPLCESLSIRFHSIKFLRNYSKSRKSRSEMLKYGHDLTEKEGIAEISCTVSLSVSAFSSIRRTSVIERKFKLVGMIPGPFCRFTFFVPQVFPGNSLNTIKGAISGRYEGKTPKRIILINGTDTFDTSEDLLVAEKNSTPKILSENGWVYLGGEKLFLNIPSGFDPPLGNTSLSKDPFLEYPDWKDPSYGIGLSEALGAGIYFGWPEFIKGSLFPRGYDFQCPELKENFKARQVLNGVFSGAEKVSMWYKPVSLINKSNLTMRAIEPDDCLTSFILPYGTRHYISRTLLFGNVFARYLSYIQLIEKSGNSQFVPKPLTGGTFSNDLPFDFAYSAGAVPQFYRDVFDQPGGAGYLSSLPLFSGFPLKNHYDGFPVNLVFDFMSFNDRVPDILEWKSPSGGIGDISDKKLVPGGRLNDAQPFRGIQSDRNISIWLGHDGNEIKNESTAQKENVAQIEGNPRSDKGFWNAIGKAGFEAAGGVGANCEDPCLYFSGDLKYLCQESFNKENLLSRVTHEVDLNPFSGDESKAIVRLMAENILRTDQSGKYYVFRKPGIYLFKRQRRDDFVFDKPLMLKSSGILILENGNFSIKGIEVEDSELQDCGISPYLFSIVALNGNIRLYPKRMGEAHKAVHAYLVALKGNLENGKLSTIESVHQGYEEDDSRIFVSGGVAFSGFSRNNMNNSISEAKEKWFGGGGIIRYNPNFNPSLPSKPQSYRIVYVE
ncbi:MAG: hypothetical protein HQM10_17595 [Candidatus Riflebacteria bacterium]|nr:hypothetical protein [Candidatus Riflebacteria bacterium]